MFIGRIADADAEAPETQVWIDFAYDCGYLPEKCRNDPSEKYKE
jgi:hypothetical protein